MTNRTIYTTGGTVQAGGGLYITRAADAELLSLCRAGAFAFVLYTRQMGKSSLMINTAQALADDNIRPVVIDLTSIGVNVTADEWYRGVLTVVKDDLDLDVNLNEWWGSYSHLGEFSA